MNTWRGSAKVVVIDAEVVVVEELHRRGVTGAAERSPRARIARKAVLEREGIRPLPSPETVGGIDTGNMPRRWPQTVLDQPVGAKAIQSKGAHGVGNALHPALQRQVPPELLFRLVRKKEGSKPQAEERQQNGAKRESRREQRVHRAEPVVKTLLLGVQVRDAVRLRECRAARRWRTKAQHRCRRYKRSQFDSRRINEPAQAASSRALRVGGVQDVGEHHILIPIRRRGHHPDIAGIQLVERAREERMRDVGSTLHIIKLPCRWDPAEPKLARSSTMPFPEKDFPILKPPDKFAIHPGLGLIDGKIRRVQEHLEHRVVAAVGSVPAKKKN